MKLYATCADVREDFSALLDNELTPDERESLEGHLSECSECLRNLDGFKKLDTLYRALPATVAPDDLERRVKDSLRPKLIHWPRIRVSKTVLGPAIAAAAVLLVVIGFSANLLRVKTDNSDLEFEMAASTQLKSQTAPMAADSATAVITAEPEGVESKPPAQQAANDGPQVGAERQGAFRVVEPAPLAEAAHLPEALPMAPPAERSEGIAHNAAPDADAEQKESSDENRARSRSNVALLSNGGRRISAQREDTGTSTSSDAAAEFETAAKDQFLEKDKSDAIGAKIGREMRDAEDTRVDSIPPAALSPPPARSASEPAPPAPGLAAANRRETPESRLDGAHTETDSVPLRIPGVQQGFEKIGGVYRQTGYADEPVIELVRDSDTFARLAGRHTDLIDYQTWDAPVIFKFENVWYKLLNRPPDARAR